MKLLSSNLEARGRWIRAAMATMLTVGCGLAWTKMGWGWLPLILGVSAVFVWFEALRGWCVLRACGVKTRW